MAVCWQCVGRLVVFLLSYGCAMLVFIYVLVVFWLPSVDGIVLLQLCVVVVLCVRCGYVCLCLRCVVVV